MKERQREKKDSFRVLGPIPVSATYLEDCFKYNISLYDLNLFFTFPLSQKKYIKKL